MHRDISSLKFEFVYQQIKYFLRHSVGHFEAHSTAKATTTQLHLDCCQQVFCVFVINRKVGISRDSKCVTLLDFHSLEKATQIGAHHIFKQHKPVAVGQL